MGDRNPHGTIQARNQYQFTTNVSAGMVGDCLLDVYVLQERLTRAVYMDFISDTLSDWLDYVLLDYALAYIYHERRTGMRGSVSLSARYPVLDTLLFIGSCSRQ